MGYGSRLLANRLDVGFPVLTVERPDVPLLRIEPIQRSSIDVDLVGVGTGTIETLYSTGGAEAVLRDVRIERVRRQCLSTGDQLEAVGVDEPVQDAFLLADGAVAIEQYASLEPDSVADAAAVTPAGAIVRFGHRR